VASISKIACCPCDSLPERVRPLAERCAILICVWGKRAVQHLIQTGGLLVAICVVATSVKAGASIYSVPWDCAKYFHDACSPAIGAWLPRVPGPPAWELATKTATTSVHDEIIDPSGSGPRTFGGLHAVARGTRFVYGMAGPPNGRLVYDPVARIALYDEGCCAWHDVVVAADVSPPPKHVVARSLTTVHTARGIVLGVQPRVVRAVFGAAPLLPVRGSAGDSLLEYRELAHVPGVISTCDESYSFLFKRGRLAAMDYGAAC
jgi:hypothetical protein